MALERETFQKSRQAFDSMYKELQRKYQEEIQSKEVSFPVASKKRFGEMSVISER